MNTEFNKMKKYASSTFCNQIYNAKTDNKFNIILMGFDVAIQELNTMNNSSLRFSNTNYYRNTFGLTGRTYKQLFNDILNLKSILENRYWNKTLFLMNKELNK